MKSEKGLRFGGKHARKRMSVIIIKKCFRLVILIEYTYELLYMYVCIYKYMYYKYMCIYREIDQCFSYQHQYIALTINKKKNH